MPDFDTRTPQEAGQEDGAATTRGRVASIATKARTLLMANKLRAVLVGRILLIVATSMVVLLFLLGGGTDGKGKGVSHPHEASHLSGKMVFAMLGKKGANIWTMNANGSDLTQLTPSSVYTEKDPNWSPDGTKIAFTTTEKEEEEGLEEGAAYPYLYVMNADGSGYTRLAKSHPAVHPTWSPNGKWIAFSSAIRQPSFLRQDLGHIYIVKADGSRERRLTTKQGLYEYPAWSPDGKKIAFVKDRNIYVIDTTGGEGGGNQPRLLRVTATLPGRPTDLAWSPDGNEIVFTILTAQPSRRSVGKQDVYKMDANGSSVTRLTHARGIEWSPTWSPEGDQIAFFTKSLWIFVMDADGPEPAPLDKKSASITFENLHAEDLNWWGELPDSPGVRSRTVAASSTV
jgi:Tol biopolymer transport system component